MSAHRSVTGAPVGRDPTRSTGRWLGWAVLTAVLGGATISFSILLPAPLVLPALSILMVAVGFTIAAGLYLAGSRMERDWNRGWELAAVLAFLGFAASILTDGGEALAVLDQMQTGRATAPSK